MSFQLTKCAVEHRDDNSRVHILSHQSVNHSASRWLQMVLEGKKNKKKTYVSQIFVCNLLHLEGKDTLAVTASDLLPSFLLGGEAGHRRQDHFQWLQH